MHRVIHRANLAAARSIPVIIEGESGTGKELLAKAIHQASPRKDKPFIVINCGAIPDDLVESELFGYEKGAFTGADSRKIGHFEAAKGGTLFLDEIGELPKIVQVKLLRVLQEGEVKRIGATQAEVIDVRIIAATNKNLVDGIATGIFREDLFYRLAVAVLKLPPLRERTGDLSLLIDTLLARVNEEASREGDQKHKKLSVSARNIMLNHVWPGNIRELLNTLTRAVVWSSGEAITEEDIREALLPIPGSDANKDTVLGHNVAEGVDLPAIMKTVASHYLQQGLEQTHGNKTQTADILGLPSYQTLSNWLKKYGLE